MLKIVQNQLEAYNSKDIDTFCACFHPEVKISALTKESSLYGLEEFRRRYSELFKAAPLLKCEIKNRIVLNDSVIDHELITNAPKNPQPYEAVAIYAFRDGLINRIWFTY